MMGGGRSEGSELACSQSTARETLKRADRVQPVRAARVPGGFAGRGGRAGIGCAFWAAPVGKKGNLSECTLLCSVYLGDVQFLANWSSTLTFEPRIAAQFVEFRWQPVNKFKFVTIKLGLMLS